LAHDEIAVATTPLQDMFRTLREDRSGAMITYFPIGVGFDSVELADIFEDCGVDVLEIGLPTRNPYLDGATVANAMSQALEAGFTVEKCFDEIARIRAKYPRKPLEVFTYSEVVADLGVDRFLKLCKDSGVDSALIGGAPPAWLYDEATSFPENFDLLGLSPFDFGDEFAREMAAAPLSGYVFFQATPGVTGKRESVEPELANRISALREHLGDLPICAGFGISNAGHVRDMRAAGADGVIVGSLALEWLSTGTVAEFSDRMLALKAALSS
jgi:tryptophan synthase alpha chain